MDRSTDWFSLAIPSGWEDVIVRAVKAFVVAFVIFTLKEFIDAGRADLLELAVDALWVGGGTVILEAILMFVKPAPKR